MENSPSAVQYNLTTRDVADLLGYTQDYIRFLVREKKIPCVKRVREYRFNAEEVQAALLTRPEDQPSITTDSVNSERGGFEQPEAGEFDDIDLGI